MDTLTSTATADALAIVDAMPAGDLSEDNNTFRTIGTATYSPDDNKLRLYPFSRLDAATYARVKETGFKWAPKQQLFVAPMWTPGREDLLTELCGEIGDEDTSLVDRAEERAERFDEYSEKRAEDAKRAKAGVDAICEHIPLGQPILVGHHSERRARKDAERIENGMRKAVKLWETSGYWKQRAAGALAHAKYKELPAVRHRRIKGIESDKRKAQKSLDVATQARILWGEPGLTHEQAWKIANTPDYGFRVRRPDAKNYFDYDSVWSLLDANKISVSEAQERAERYFSGIIARNARWIAHYDNRLAYERAMLAEAIGADTASDNPLADKFRDIEAGGRVLVGKYNPEWLVVIRVNRKDGAINSLTTQAPASVTWSKTWKFGIEEIKDYKAPAAEDAAKVKKATTLPPLCNYPGDGIKEMTQAEWKRIHSDYKGTRELGVSSIRPGGFRSDLKDADALAGKFGRHRVRVAMIGGGRMAQVFLTDAKRTDPPPPPAPDELPLGQSLTFAREFDDSARTPRPQYKAPEKTEFDAMRDQLKQGVKVVSAPQLFPTPAAAVEKMISYAGIAPGDRVLEPSAGTGAILRGLPNLRPGGYVVAVEINPQLAAGLEEIADETHCADFLAWDTEDRFDVVMMNPPFKDGADIKHILHARKFLRDGGKVVAICADGPRQRETLQPLADHWEELPVDTFKEQGTSVRTALLVMGKGDD